MGIIRDESQRLVRVVVRSQQVVHQQSVAMTLANPDHVVVVADIPGVDRLERCSDLVCIVVVRCAVMHLEGLDPAVETRGAPHGGLPFWHALGRPSRVEVDH